MQAGLYFGAVDMTDGMLARIKTELKTDAVVVATGGQARLVSRGSKYIQHIDEFLTLRGLRLIWEKNQHSDGHRDQQPTTQPDAQKSVTSRKVRN
jgi:type III pantothenate kinase